MLPITESDPARLAQLASGRRIVNMCLFSWLAASGFHVTTSPGLPAGLFFLGVTIASVVGVVRLTEGLGISGFKRVLLILGAIMPVIGWLVMGWLGSRAGKVLTAAGYQVGIFVALKPDKPC